MAMVVQESTKIVGLCVHVKVRVVKEIVSKN
jgi:hypothetical protein